MVIASQAFNTAPFPTDFKVVKSVSLQYTDMAGGNNKFYVLELHEAAGKYRLYSCYGRTGKDGVKEERIAGTLEKAEKEFETIRKSKIKKGYHEIQLANTSKGTSTGNNIILSTDVKSLPTTTKLPSKQLDPALAKLVQRLYSEAGTTCQTQLSGRLQTTKENPLGTLTLSQINTGKKVLQEINDYIVKINLKKPNFGPSAGTGYEIVHDDRVIELSNEFYSAVPQEIPLRPRDEDGRKRWLIQHCLNTASKLDEKRDLLDLLSDVQGMIGGFETDDIERKYEEILCSITECPKDSEDFRAAEHFLTSTQSKHHNWKLRLKNCYRISSKAQSPYRQTMDQIGNIKPLFHGSRAANILGICKNGLLVRPPGAYVTGGMFGGRAVYFADQSTKSSQYATARYGGSSGSGDTYFMFIADVALGNIKEYQDAQPHLQTPPSGYHSVKGVAGRSLVHNEFMIYDIRQNQLQYLMEFEQH